MMVKGATGPHRSIALPVYSSAMFDGDGDGKLNERRDESAANGDWNEMEASGMKAGCDASRLAVLRTASRWRASHVLQE